MLQNELEERVELQSAKIIETKEDEQVASLLTNRLLGRTTINDCTTFELTYSDGSIRTERVKNTSLLYRVYSSKI